jgi:hypothetical protein
MNTGSAEKHVGIGLCGRWVLCCLPVDLALIALSAYATNNNGNETSLHIMTSLMAITLSLVSGALILHYLLTRQSPALQRRRCKPKSARNSPP